MLFMFSLGWGSTIDSCNYRFVVVNYQVTTCKHTKYINLGKQNVSLTIKCTAILALLFNK